MAFSFGSNTQQPAFGSPARPTGFGTPFGATPATTAASTGFGGGGFGQSQPSFGAPPSSAPPTFGAPSAAPAFGASTQATPGFGGGFGTQQGQTGTGLFGTQTTKPGLFGAAPSSTPSLFSSQQGGTTSLFGTTTSQAPSLFGSTGTSTTPSLFGTTATSSAPSLFGTSFGQTATTSAPSLFGGTGSTFGTGGGLFGSTTTSTPSLFGGFGTTTSTAGAPGTGGFGGFGSGSTGFGGFGSTQPQGGLFGSTGFGARPPGPQSFQQAPPNKNQQVVASVYAINVFNDERDDILKKWNMLQACWGTGKGYYNASQPPVDYTPQNPYYRFKAMGYNVIPEQDNSDGIVRLLFNKKIAELKNQQEVLKNGIAGILGNKPNLTVDVTVIKAVSDTQTEVKICVSEKGVTGSVRKIPATDLSAFLNQPTQKQQLSNVGVLSITPYVTPSKAELEEYLKNPPPGIDPQMWQAAIQDNPNPKKYIPVAINGFSDLRSRMLHQEYQTGLHQAFLEKVNKDITQLKTRHAASTSQINELKQKFLEMQHRILKVLVKQESSRKVGIAIQPEEELLRGRLESMHAQLNIPTQFKGQINELLSHVKMIESSQKHSNHNYRIDADAQAEIHQFLKMEQNGIAQLIKIVNNDLQALKIISEGLRKLVPNQQQVMNIN